MTQIKPQEGSEESALLVVHVLVRGDTVLDPCVQETSSGESERRETETEGPFGLLVFAEANPKGGLGMDWREDGGYADTLRRNDPAVESDKLWEDVMDGEWFLVRVEDELNLEET
jgi:hypothetical protein